MRKISILGVLFFLLSVLTLPASGFSGEGGTFYTKLNIWYEKPMKIYSTNYHKGALITVGTKVKILSKGRARFGVGKKAIKFREVETGMEARIVLIKDYTNLNSEEFFNRYFSSENVLNSSEYVSFSSMEKKNIEEGTIEVGMSKAAVLMAYGYPPSHKTPSVETDFWTYWRSRLISFSVKFMDGRVIKVLD